MTASATLTLVRDANIPLDQLAAQLSESIPFAAGLAEAVCGDADWQHAQQSDGIEPTEAERTDYGRGFMTGLALVDEEARDHAHGTFEEWVAALDAAVSGNPSVAS